MSAERQYPARPILGVGAVVVADDRRIVLVSRAHEPLKGVWSLPGGAVDPGETLEAAVAREIAEETGLVVAVGHRLGVVEHIERDPDGRVRYHFVIVDYLCRVTGGRLRAGSDAASVCLAGEAEWPALGLTERTHEVIGMAFRQLARGEPEP